MRPTKPATFVALAVMLASCGDGGGSSSPTPVATAGPTPTATSAPTPAASADCSLAGRKSWALGQLEEWYLFPDLLDRSVNAASYPDLQSYLDALVAPARAQSKDRYFTFYESRSESEAYRQSGATAGFGLRLAYAIDSAGAYHLLVTEAYESAPAFGAGIDRGAEIVSIGTSDSNLRTIASIYAAGGGAAVNEALGPSTPGTTRVLRVQSSSGTRTVTVAKQDFNLSPLSTRYGVKVLDGVDGQKVGYVNLRTFIPLADAQLRDAFGTLKAQGITRVIVDVRYNGGGSVATADLFSNLLSSGRAGKVMHTITFSPKKSDENETTYFASEPNAIAPMRIAFIGTGQSASASELIVNVQTPYLGDNVALVGSNTFGKPSGQVLLDRPACDDRLYALALQIFNANGVGGYYTGLVGTVPKTCSANDDISRPLGDERESSVSVALNFLAGRSCVPISAGASAQQSLNGQRRPLQQAEAVQSLAQRDIPGLH